MVGLIFYNVAPGLGARSSIPPDGLVGEKPMPECPIVGTWRTGKAVHRLIEGMEPIKKVPD